MSAQPETKVSPSALVGIAVQPLVSNASRGPYETQQELIDDQLVAIRQRLRVAAEHLESSSERERAVNPWPSDLLALEARIEARVRASRDPRKSRRRDHA